MSEVSVAGAELGVGAFVSIGSKAKEVTCFFNSQVFFIYTGEDSVMFPHFTNEETEAERKWLNHLRLQSCWVWGGWVLRQDVEWRHCRQKK